MTSEAAIEELRRHAGTQFHTRVVETFISILEREQALEASGEQPLSDLGPEADSLWDAPLTTAAAHGVFVTAGGRLMTPVEHVVNADRRAYRRMRRPGRQSFICPGACAMLTSRHLSRWRARSSRASRICWAMRSGPRVMLC